MYCVIQFYLQLRKDLAPYSVFLKVLSIKLVIFLSFWQTSIISVLTSSLGIVQAGSTLAYPDLIVGIPSLLLCIEMSLFAVLHLFAFPWTPYSRNAKTLQEGKDIGPKQGGFLGLKAIADAMNPWDLVKAFARGMRWIFVGRKHRQHDSSYKPEGFNSPSGNDMTLQSTAETNKPYENPDQLPIASEFRRSRFGIPTGNGDRMQPEEGAALINHAQPNPLNPGDRGYQPTQRYDNESPGKSSVGTAVTTDDEAEHFTRTNPTPGSFKGGRDSRRTPPPIGRALSDSEPYQSQVPQTQNSTQYLPYTPGLNPALEPEPRRPREQWANTQGPRRPSPHSGSATPDSNPEYSLPQPPSNVWPLPPQNRGV